MQSARLLPFVAARSRIGDPEREQVQEFYGRFDDLLRELRGSFSEIEMFASSEVLEAATVLRNKVDVAMSVLAASRMEIDEDGKARFNEPDEQSAKPDEQSANRDKEDLADIERLRRAFIKVARKELGVDRY